MTIYVNKINQQFFPFSPEYSSWEDWVGNFIIYYGQENIPVTSENDWKVTANSIYQTTTFSAFPLMDPDGYSSWQPWAEAVSQSINGKSH